jgi:hypothetical protein
LPLLAGWLLVAWRTRRFVPTWLVGITLGVALRMVVLSHYRRNELAFLAVALAFNGAVASVVWRDCCDRGARSSFEVRSPNGEPVEHLSQFCRSGLVTGRGRSSLVSAGAGR